MIYNFLHSTTLLRDAARCSFREASPVISRSRPRSRRTSATTTKPSARTIGDLKAALPWARQRLRPVRRDAPLKWSPGATALAGRTSATTTPDATQDRIGDAIEQFQESIPSVGAYPNLTLLHIRRGDLAIWESDLRHEAATKPFDPAAQFAIGQVLRYERKPLEAVVFLERALDLSPNACEVLSELGITYLDLARVDKAVGVLQRCLSISPEDYPALVNLGDAYIEQGALDRARTLFEHANTVRPDGAEALIDLGYIQDSEHSWEGAVRLYLRALALDPLARDGYVDLGCDYRDHHLYALAEAAFIKGLSVSPGDGRLHYLLGTTYAEQGKSVLARSEYKLALSSNEPEVALSRRPDLAALPQ
jgi:tetratricopeptide (TPR) repeat protein